MAARNARNFARIHSQPLPLDNEIPSLLWWERYVPACDDPMHDKLYKVRFLTDHPGKRFAEEFMPHQQVAVDECMIPFRCRLSFKQNHKDKPTKWGIKVWILADSQTGV